LKTWNVGFYTSAFEAFWSLAGSSLFRMDRAFDNLESWVSKVVLGY